MSGLLNYRIPRLVPLGGKLLLMYIFLSACQLLLMHGWLYIYIQLIALFRLAIKSVAAVHWLCCVGVVKRGGDHSRHITSTPSKSVCEMV